MSKVQKTPPHVQIFGLTFAFFLTGMLMFMIAMVAGIWIFPELIEQQSVRNTNGWALAHLFLLGFATMIAMGASYQLTQVLLRTSIYSRFLGALHYMCYAVGFILLTLSFIFSFTKGIVIGGTLVIAGVTLYIWNITKTFIDKKEWNPFHFGVGLSLLSLFLTVTAGLLMGLSFTVGWALLPYNVLFTAHLWLGIGGWLSGLIVVYSFKLIPMFYSSPRKATGEAYLILALFHAGIWIRITASGLFSKPLTIIAHVLILVSLAIYFRYIWDVPRHTRSRMPVPGGSVTVAYNLNFAVFIIVLLWSSIIFIWPDRLSTLPISETVVIFLIIGWFAASILSYMSKIVPFLWWGYQFQTKWKKKSKVLLSNMTRDKRLLVFLYSYLLGIVLVCLGFLLAHPVVGFSGQLIAAACAILYLLELTRVFRY